jgi:hypothetical protein
MERVMRRAYEGFLTEVEIDALIKGADLWLDAQEWCRRWEARNEWLQTKVSEEVKAMLQQVVPVKAKPARKPRKKKEA